MKKTAGLLILVLSLFCIAGCSEDKPSHVDEIKNGYLGGSFDVTLGEVLESAIPGGNWDGGETNDGEKIAEYKATIEDTETRIQFKMTDSNHFKVSAIKVADSSPSDNRAAAQYMYGKYVSYFAYKYPDKAAAEFMPNEDEENILYGITASYVSKVKNPIELSEYIDKKPSELQSAIEIKDDGDEITYVGDGFSVMCMGDTIDTVTLDNSRVVTLFGINTFSDLDTVNAKLSENFEFLQEKENNEGTYDAMYLRNGTEDALTVTYDKDTGYILDIMYIKDALGGLL